jgi:hypothetical protein
MSLLVFSRFIIIIQYKLVDIRCDSTGGTEEYIVAQYMSKIYDHCIAHQQVM